MNQPLQLVGEVEDRDQRVIALERTVSALEADVRALRQELKNSQRVNAQAIARFLSPLYNALKPTFGEIAQFDEQPGATGNRANAWEAVKQRLAPRLREAVDLLLLQGTMRRTQLANALKMDYSNCTKNVIGVLIRQGWVVNNGGNLSLKEL